MLCSATTYAEAKAVEQRREARKGKILHVYRSVYAFLHNQEIIENGGVFVVPARSIVSVAPHKNQKKKDDLDLTKMNPEMMGRLPTGVGLAGPGQRFKRDEDIGRHCFIIKGPNKGLQGIIKDVNGQLARVELHTNNKTISIEKTKLGAKE